MAKSAQERSTTAWRNGPAALRDLARSEPPRAGGRKQRAAKKREDD